MSQVIFRSASKVTNEELKILPDGGMGSRLSNSETGTAKASMAPFHSNVILSFDISVASEVLRRSFGFESFMPLQAEIIQSVLQGQDTIGLLATGSGKSLAYQFIPLYRAALSRNGLARVRSGTAIVVSPLLSLIEDQMTHLASHGISAAALTGDSPLEIWDEVQRGKHLVVFITPEQLSSTRGIACVARLHRDHGVCLLAVDESHCVSQWGHDFRESFLRIHKAREHLPGVPCLALTATATHRVREDIEKQLRLRRPRVIVSSLNRPNLSYRIQRSQGAADQAAKATAVLKTTRGAAIVYVHTRKQADSLAAQLRLACRGQGRAVAAYHAGMDNERRRTVHRKFLLDQIDTVVATIAFGMGIDKKDIRTVVHCGLPTSIEGYYQETGRAGRDGEPSQCLLLWSDGDVSKIGFALDTASKVALCQQMRRLAMVGEASPREFRREVLAYFGEHFHAVKRGRWGAEGAAMGGGGESNSAGGAFGVDLSPEMALMVAALRWSTESSTTAIIGLLRGSPPTKLRRSWSAETARVGAAFGSGKVLSKEFWMGMLRVAEDRGMVQGQVTAVPSGGGTNAFVSFALTAEGERFFHCVGGAPLRTDVGAPDPTGRCKGHFFVDCDRLTPEMLAALTKRGRLRPSPGHQEALQAAQRAAMAAMDAGRIATLAASSSHSSLSSGGAAAVGGVAGATKACQVKSGETALSSQEATLFERLKPVRLVLAEAAGVPAFCVASDRTLRDMVRQRPSTTEGMLRVHGMGEVKVERYGSHFLQALKEGAVAAGLTPGAGAATTTTIPAAVAAVEAAAAAMAAAQAITASQQAVVSRSAGHWPSTYASSSSGVYHREPAATVAMRAANGFLAESTVPQQYGISSPYSAWGSSGQSRSHTLLQNYFGGPVPAPTRRKSQAYAEVVVRGRFPWEVAAEWRVKAQTVVTYVADTIAAADYRGVPNLHDASSAAGFPYMMTLPTSPAALRVTASTLGAVRAALREVLPAAEAEARRVCTETGQPVPRLLRMRDLRLKPIRQAALKYLTPVQQQGSEGSYDGLRLALAWVDMERRGLTGAAGGGGGL